MHKHFVGNLTMNKSWLVYTFCIHVYIYEVIKLKFRASLYLWIRLSYFACLKNPVGYCQYLLYMHFHRKMSTK